MLCIPRLGIEGWRGGWQAETGNNCRWLQSHSSKISSIRFNSAHYRSIKQCIQRQRLSCKCIVSSHRKRCSFLWSALRTGNMTTLDDPSHLDKTLWDVPDDAAAPTTPPLLARFSTVHSAAALAWEERLWKEVPQALWDKIVMRDGVPGLCDSKAISKALNKALYDPRIHKVCILLSGMCDCGYNQEPISILPFPPFFLRTPCILCTTSSTFSPSLIVRGFH